MNQCERQSNSSPPGQSFPEGFAEKASHAHVFRMRQFVYGVGRVMARLGNSVAGALLTACLLSLVFMTIPTLVLTEGMEAAWSSVLWYAHEKGLQFGSEILHPYGPLGFLIAPHFIPQLVVGRTIVDVMLSLMVASGVCLLAWRLKVRWRSLVLLVFGLLTSNIDYAPHDLLINLGVFAWGLLCILESRPRLRIYATCLVLLAVFGGLAKISCLILAVMTIFALALDFFLRGRPWLGLGTVAGFALGTAGGWMLLGQSLSNFGVYFVRGLITSGGYSQTMALEPPGEVLVGGLLTLGFVMALAVTKCLIGARWYHGPFPFRRIIAFGWITAILFLTWKHGFLRADMHHSSLFLGFVAVATLLMQTLPSAGARNQAWSSGLAWTGCIVSLLTLQTLLYPDFIHLDRPFHRAAFNAQTLINPFAYREQMGQSSVQQKKLLELPAFRKEVGRATVDVFGNYQSYAVLNKFNYRPRPVFQSYTAFNLPLMRANEEFYYSKARPDYCILRLHAIDDRFPALEDALLFRDLLINCEFTAAENWCLLVKVQPMKPVRLTLLDEGAVRRGERIDFSKFGETNIWMQIELKQTIAGRVRQLFYQPSIPRLIVHSRGFGERGQRFKAPLPMLAAGFVASPLLTGNEDFIKLYHGTSVVRPESYSIEIVPTAFDLWKPDVRYRIYKIENPIGFRFSPEVRGALGPVK